MLSNACENDLQKVNIVTTQNEAFISKGKQVEILYSDSGITQVKIIAPTVINHMTKDPYTEMPNGITIYFYDYNMNIESKVQADYGITYENQQLMKVRKNVIVTNAKNEILNAEELIWDEKKAMIYSDKFVKITTADEIIYGEGFEANEDFTNYKIKKIKGTINITNPDSLETVGNE